MKRPEIFIETSELMGSTTVVYLVRFNEDGEEEKIDISICCRAVEFKTEVGEVNTAKLEVFVTGSKLRAEIEGVVLEELKPPRRGWRSRLVDATTFSQDGSRWWQKVRA